MARSGEVRIRRTAPSDAAGVAAVANALSQELYGETDLTEDEVARWWDEPDVEGWVAVDTGGRVAAYAGLNPRERDRLFLGLRRGRGGEAELLAVGEARARELAAPGAVLRSPAASADGPTRELLAGAGFRVVRHWFHMSVDLSRELAPPRWPDGIAVRTSEPGRDDRRVWEADNEAFADHWEFRPLEYERFRRWTIERPDFDPTLWFLAEDGGEIAGFALCHPHPSGDPAVGRVAALGVRPRWRRRGVALALLVHAFAVFRERGMREARLEVDAENPTGAVALYERAGMTVVRRYETHEKRL